MAEKRGIKITSHKNGQEISEQDGFEMKVDARDIKGRHVDDDLTILVDGKNEGHISSSWQEDPEKPGEYKFNDKYSRKLFLDRGVRTIVVIAKPRGTMSSGVEIGRSEPITLIVK